MNITTEYQEKIEKVFEQAGYGLIFDNLVASSDTLARFIEVWGQPVSVSNGVSIWERIQTRPGKTRGDLAVLPTESGTLTYFGGEA